MRVQDRRREGFSLVELAVVIVIVGVLAAFGVPRYRDSVERTKAAEAFNYLAAVRSAQERHLTHDGQYSAGTKFLDIQLDPPRYFNKIDMTGAADVDLLTHEGDPGWEMVLSRDSASSSYGAYKVVFSERGYVPNGAAWAAQTSNIPITINPTTL